MIREYDTSEFLSTIILARNEAHKYESKGKVGFKRVFTISHRVMKENPTIRIRISTTSIRSFCAFMKIECQDQEIILKKLDNHMTDKLQQFRPLDERATSAFIKANF